MTRELAETACLCLAFCYLGWQLRDAVEVLREMTRRKP